MNKFNTIDLSILLTTGSTLPTDASIVKLSKKSLRDSDGRKWVATGFINGKICVTREHSCLYFTV